MVRCSQLKRPPYQSFYCGCSHFCNFYFQRGQKVKISTMNIVSVFHELCVARDNGFGFVVAPHHQTSNFKTRRGTEKLLLLPPPHTIIPYGTSVTAV